MIQIASRCFALLLASVILAAAAEPAEARTRTAHHHAARHHHRTADRTAVNDTALKGTSDDLDKTLNDRIRNICRGC